MQHMNIPDARLMTALPYIRRGDRVIDVGTDHAYLPIYLVSEGLVSCALACDINQGPIDSARANIREAGLSGRIDTRKTDGLTGTEDFSPDDILIFGMGGELIVRILSDAPWIRDGEIRLILQPTSRAAVLRRWLFENGFLITGETLSYEGKYYQTICASFAPLDVSGEPPYSEEEFLLGRRNMEDNAPLFRGFLAHEIGVLENIIRGKERSPTADAEGERQLLKILKERMEKTE